jgi:hypothetical protein
MSAAPDLDAFLEHTKAGYLAAAAARTADDWLLIMGNEAGGAHQQPHTHPR